MGKSFCVDCGKWRTPFIDDIGGLWCPICFPKGRNDWNRIRGAKYAHFLKKRDYDEAVTA